MMRRVLFLSMLSFLIFSCRSSKIELPEVIEYTDAIRLNQLGYYPGAVKKAIIANSPTGDHFLIVELQGMKKVWEGKLGAATFWQLAAEDVRVADFSSLKAVGSYSLYVPGVGYSFPFRVSNSVYHDALASATKSYYFQRAGMALEPIFAGQWSRPAGHPDDQVLFHASSGREGTTASGRGWYDAGDYGKYVVNGAFSLGQMLFLYEQYPDLLPDNSLYIPESGNGVPDLLDELKYEMDWLLTMQDDDGGLFCKLTTLGFSGMVLPHEANEPRYIIGKGTAATLDFAAAAAKMSQALKDLDPLYAEKCLGAALAAWEWAVRHPALPFRNPPDVRTGEYGDSDFSDEFYWAASELYVATRDQRFLPYVQVSPDFTFKEGESWANYMHFLGAFTLMEHIDNVSLITPLKKAILATANGLVAQSETNDYFQPVDEFFWGSNSDVLNAAMIVAHAYRINPRQEYLDQVTDCISYILGRNATGYSFLTGFGSQSPMNIHHRPSAGDKIEEPVPGLLSGGPNYGKHDAFNVKYPEDAPPMKCWVDVQESFASNEVCINWNAPLVYVLGFLEATDQ